ncbi:MAG TPA: LPXTG cell wall anchor domain-containing protein, partial [Leptolinea sp.]
TSNTGGSKSNLTILLGVMCALTLVVGGVLAFLLLRRKKDALADGSGSMSAGYSGDEMEDVSEEAAGGTLTPAPKKRGSSDAEEPPVVQFMTTYMLGDDLYDDSFSIDAPTGEFLGECGVGISETIGVGDPKKVTAFEVWLFDKNDIQTVTKVLLSSHGFNDPNIRQRLLAKGEPQLVEPGKRILLETASLQMEARIVDASYGGGALPTNSYFDRLTLELAVWPKSA